MDKHKLRRSGEVKDCEGKSHRLLATLLEDEGSFFTAH